jgi:hypothetical protein
MWCYNVTLNLTACDGAHHTLLWWPEPSWSDQGRGKLRLCGFCVKVVRLWTWIWRSSSWSARRSLTASGVNKWSSGILWTGVTIAARVCATFNNATQALLSLYNAIWWQTMPYKCVTILHYKRDIQWHSILSWSLYNDKNNVHHHYKFWV